jgi:dihydroorotase
VAEIGEEAAMRSRESLEAGRAGRPRLDMVITGGRVVDPASNRDGLFDVGISGDRIVAVRPHLTPDRTTTVVEAAGSIVCPGLIDLHTHVYEHATDLGVPADDVGVHAGVTTVVDQGSTGAWMFPGLRAQVIDRATTEVKAFLLVLLIGSCQGNRGGPSVFNVEYCDPDAVVRMHARFPEMIRGVKTYGESGGYSLWHFDLLQLARKAADESNLPLYVHTGEVLVVDEQNRPRPEQIMPAILDYVKPGDLLAHCYSDLPDGLLGDAEKPSPELIDKVRSGVHLDVGHGINFSFDTARRLLDAGLLPYTISSDVHGTLGNAYHDDTALSYSLVGAMSKLLGLGMTLHDVLTATTVSPARVLRMEDEIGTLDEGTRADITVLDVRRDDWRFYDGRRNTLDVGERLVPKLVIRAGRPIVPSGRLLRDVLPPEERGEAGLSVAVGGEPR